MVIYVASRDADLQPESVVAMGAQAHCESKRLTVFLPLAPSRRTLANLEANGDMAVTLTRPADHKSLQLKGKVLAIRPSTEADHALQAVHRAALTEQFAQVGVPRNLTRRLALAPSMAVEIQVHDAFVQTPGPGAGERMRSP